MEDRNVQFPQRYRLQKVAGTDDIFDLIPAPGEIAAEGTFLNKAALLKDATAALFGLDKTAVPDDVLALLSRFQAGMGNEYLWDKRASREVTETSTATNYPRSATVASPVYGADLTVWSSYTYEDGVFAVSGESLTVTISPSSCNDENEQAKVARMAGYYYVSGNVLYQIPEGCRAVRGGSGQSNYWAIDSSQATKKFVVNEVVGYVNSPDPNAYPPAVPDGFTYNLLGQLGQGMAKAEVGSYVGTGTYGASNPNSLTFKFVPKYIIMVGNSGAGMYGNTNYQSSRGVILDVVPTTYTQGGSYSFALNNSYMCFGKKSEDGMSYYWYSDSSASYQFNTAGVTYYFLVIG